MNVKTDKTKLATTVAKLSMKAFFQYRKVLLILAFFAFFTLNMNAQPPPPGGTGPSCWPPPCIPIDGGISWLLAAGIVYGAKKSWDFGKKAGK